MCRQGLADGRAMLRRRTRVRLAHGFALASSIALERANHQSAPLCARVNRQAPRGVRKNQETRHATSRAQASAIRRAYITPAQVLRFIFTKG
jgi:hypothetical protein